MDNEMMIRQYINKNWCYGDLESQLGKCAADIVEYHHDIEKDQWHVFDDVSFQKLAIEDNQVICLAGHYCDCDTHEIDDSQLEAYALHMDDNLRERVHSNFDFSTGSAQEFLDRYQKLHFAKYGDQLTI